MSEWIESLGYLGAYFGAVVEGEFLFVAALQTVRLGYLDFYYVLLAVFLGAQTIDWTLFLAGRKGGQKAIERRPKLQMQFARMSQAVESRSTFLLLSYRFMYGFRFVLPTLFGAAAISVRRFALLSFISTSLWVLVVGNAGYFFAEALMDGLLVAKNNLAWGGAAVLLLGGGWWFWHRTTRGAG